MAFDDLQDDVDQFMSGRRSAGKSTPRQVSADASNDVDSFMFKRRTPERQPYGPPLDATDPKQSSRYKEAASQAAFIESSRRRATSLFQQADQTPENEVASRKNANGSDVPVFSGQGFTPMPKRQFLRDAADAELAKANFAAEEARKNYGDLLEVGYGADADPKSKRQWAYAKPKHTAVMIEQARLEKQSGQPAPSSPPLRARAQTTRPNAVQDIVNRVGATATSGLASIPESFGRLLDTLTPTGAETVASQPSYARLTPEQRALIASHQGSEAEKTQIAANMLESNKALAAMDINERNKQFSIGEKFRPLTRAGQREAETVFPTDPSVEGSANPLKPGFYRRTLPEALGSTIPFMISHKVGTGMGLSGRTVAGAGGVGLEVANEYEQAEKAGATPEQLKKIVQAATVAGATEAFGAESLLGKIGLKGKSIPGHLAKEILGEAGQEASQSLIEDLGAKYYARTQPNLTAEQIAQNALENAVPAAFLGAGGGVAGIPGHRAEQRASQQEAAKVAVEPGAPMNLVPTVPEGTQTDVRRIAPKPVDLVSQKAQQSNQQGAQQAGPQATAAQPAQPIQAVAPATGEASLLFPQATAPTATEDLSGLQGPERVAKMLENVRRMREGKTNATIEQQINKDFGDASGLLDAAETNWDTDRPSAELYVDQGVKKLKASLQNLQNSPGYQAELAAAAQGQALPATPYTSAAQSINQRLARADALIRRDAENERALKESQAAAEAAQKEADKLQRKSEKEQAKAARIQTREELQQQREIAVEERKAQLAAERSAAAEVRRQKQEAAKATRRAELEKMRANAQNEKQAKLAEAELQRLASHDAALKAADDAGQRSQKFHAEGRTAEAVNELVVQQNQIRDAMKFLPRTPEAQNTKADLNRYFGQVGNRIGDLRRESRGVRGPVTEAIPPLMRPDAAVNPDGGVPPVQSFYTPGAGFERLAAGQKEASDDQRPLLTAIRQMGGISDDGDTSGELRRLGVKESGTTGIVNNRTGLSPDEMRAQLAEDGYLPPDSTVDDLYQAIEGEMRAGARKEESISDFYDRFAEEDGGAEGRGDGETRPSFDDIAAEVEAEQEQPSEEELDQAAYRRALDRSIQNRGERVAPGEPGKGKSLSGFNTMLSRHVEKIDRLREMNLNSPEAKQIIEEIRADNEKMAIEYNRRHLTPHLDELLTMIMSDQFTALAEEDGDLREQIIEEARALPEIRRTAIEREVAAIDEIFNDEDMRELLDRAVSGDDNAVKDFTELGVGYYGIQQETAADLIESRVIARREAKTLRGYGLAQSNAPRIAEQGKGPERKTAGQLTDRERQLLNLKPDDIFDDRFDDYMAKIEDIHARAVRGELDIDPQTIQDPARWVGLSPEEVEQRRAAGERAPILNRIHAARSARVEENRLPARENIETINKYMHADLLSLAAPSKKNRMSRLDEVINAARITVEKKPSGMSAAKLAEVNDLLQRALSARAEYLAANSEEARTVSHPDPAIDGKRILATTADGRVIVENADNQAGISVVKDRGAEALTDNAPHEFSSTQVNLSGSIAEKIAEFAKRIPDADLADDGREDQPHITVKYGLHGDNADEVRAALSGEKPIKVTFGKVSLFQTNDDYDVVKVDVDSPDLHRLNKKIAELPHTDTFPDYKPHATIAYVKKGKGGKYAGNRFLNGQVARLSSLVFSDKNRQQVEIQLDGKPADPSREKLAPQLPKTELKEPWQMTKDNFENDFYIAYDNHVGKYVAVKRGSKSGEADFSGHERSVRLALSEGKPVPPEVLADYPDLTKPSEKEGGLRKFLKEEGGSASLGLGIPQIGSRLFAQPKTTPLREILEDHKPLQVDPFKIQDQTLEAIYKAGTEGTLPGARALYWANKLKAKKVSNRILRFQINFIESTLDKANKLIEASEEMKQATRGGIEYQAAKKKIERLNLQIANAISRMGEYTHPAAYAAKAYKANLLSAPHIHLFNVLEQVFKFPFHEGQRIIDFMVPTKTFQKYGVPYEKGITDFRDLVPAIEAELRGLTTGILRSPRDIADMLRYGITRQMQAMDAAENDHAGGTDKFELGHRAKMIPGVDQVINFIGRTHGAADVAFGNMINASLIGAQANAIARKAGKAQGLSEEDVRSMARDLANEPSAAMVILANDATERFKLDYPTFAYEWLQAFRDWPGQKIEQVLPGKIAKQVDAVFKAAVDFVVPFSKIPFAAIDTYLFRYSPVGLARTAGRLSSASEQQKQGKQATGRFTGEMAAQRHAGDTAELFRQGVVGTLAWALMGTLASFAYIRFQGGREDDDDRRNVSNVREILGQAYKQEMVIGDTSFDLHRMGPLGEATAIGSRMYQAGQPRSNPLTGEPEDAFKRAGRVAKAAWEGGVLNNPLGSAAKDIAGDDSHSSMIGSYIGGKTRGLVPGLLRDIAKIQNPTKVIPDDTSLGARLKAGMQSGMPFDAGFGSRKEMAPRLDALGNPVEEPNPFQFSRPVKHDPQLEEMLRLGVGIGKPQRKQGVSSEKYNQKIVDRAQMTREALDRIAADPLQASRPDAAKARIYATELDKQGMQRGQKISAESQEVENQIEDLRIQAYQELRATPQWKQMDSEERDAARKRIDDQLKVYRATAGHSSKTRNGREYYVKEKAASAPGYSPEDLARMALGNVP